ncbi:MAG: N-acetyltransferase family protein [Halodesulfurarchaeum sp.]
MVRPYRDGDAPELWALKRHFETGLAEKKDAADETDAYREKLDEDYRRNYLDWVDRCRMEAPRAVQVAEDDRDTAPEGQLAGYVFVLPPSLAYIWDAAVLNEIFVRKALRGTGVGDELMGEALDVARSQDLPLDRVVLDVDQSNERASQFYERWGFEHWGEMVARDL